MALTPMESRTKTVPFMDVFHSSGVFSLNLTFFHVFLAGVAFHTFDICVDNDLLGESARTSRMRTRM